MAVLVAAPAVSAAAPSPASAVAPVVPATAPAPTPLERAPVVDVPRVSATPRLEEFLRVPEAGAEIAGFAHVTGFIQREPVDGAPATQRTHVYLAYDERELHVVFVALDENPGRIRAHLSRRDQVFGDDIVEVMLDTFADRRRAYVFVANPLGVQWDALWTEGQGFDPSFDTLWYSEGRRTERGYVVRISLPFKSLRFSSQSPQTWGLLLLREIPAANEQAFWPEVSQRVEGRLSREATLRGLEGISPGRNVQFLPYATSRSFRALDADAEGGPRFDQEDVEGDTGVDGKIVVNDNLVLDLTANPDFSQVESDAPQVTVNQRFEVFFPEKRPFFLENANFFQTPITLLFTRRIADPRLGARLSGKLGPWALGALLIDDEAPGKRVASGGPLSGKRAGFGVVRLSRDVLSQSSVGVFASDRELADGHNRVGAVDARLKLDDHWTGNLQAVATSTRFQDGTGAAGPAYWAILNRSGRHLNQHLHYLDFGAGFVSLPGFVRRTGIREVHQRLGHTFRPEGKTLVWWEPNVFWSRIWDREGQRLDWSVSPGLAWGFQRQTGANVFARFFGERLRPEDAAGLTRARDFTQWTAGASVNTSPVNALSARLRVTAGRTVNFVPVAGEPPSLANRLGVRAGLTLRPTGGLRIENTWLLTRLTDRGGGGRIFDNQIVRTRWSWQLDRRLSLRAIVQFDQTLADASRTSLEPSRNVNADLLVTYQVNAWTALFAGFNTNYRNQRILDGPGGPQLDRTRTRLHNDARQVFVKLSYLFRL